MKTFCIITGALYGLFDRLRELTTFDSWLVNWCNYWNLKAGDFWFHWWGSVDKYELQEWYLYSIRDAYHTFKNLCVILFFLALLWDFQSKSLWHRLYYVFLAYLSFSIVQIVLGYFIKYG